MATKQEQTDQAQQRLLYAGFEVLKLKGVKALTAAQIAEAAGVSKGGFFHHFPKIEDYYLFMLDQLIQGMETQIFKQKPASLVEFLQVSVQSALDMIDETPEMMTAIYYFIDFSRFNEDYTQRLRHLVKASLDKWVHDLEGFFPQGLSEEKKTYFVYLLDIYFSGLSTHYLVLKDQDFYVKISEQFIGMIVNYLEESQP